MLKGLMEKLLLSKIDHNVTLSGRSKRKKRTTLFLAASFSLVSISSGIVPPKTVSAVTSIPTGNGATWEIQDASAPGLDTGSIRTVSGSPVQGFGNIFVRVSGKSVSGKTEPLFNGEMMRGFGLEFDGEDTFETTQAVDLGGVHITRNIQVDPDESRTRYFDSFTNMNKKAVTVEVSFGGTLGYGSGANQGMIQATSDGDKTITSKDAWSLVATSNSNQRPVGVVMGTPAPFSGAITKLGNQERNPFETPMAATGHEANFYGYVNSLTINPGETKSLARFVYVGATGPEAKATAAKELEELSGEPDFSGLSMKEMCTIRNWDLTKLSEIDADSCTKVTKLDIPMTPKAVEPYTSAKYDVVNKTIAEMQKDMETGKTTSEEITRAYLDRIAVYDSGQFGFNAFITVADNAIEQAKAADKARKNGTKGELLGIPIAIKDLFDTKDMPTTGGTLALENWQPKEDAYQVEKLREAGAVLIGKTNLSEFAFSGSYSESGFGQVWNALYPSKTSFGSSGGSAVAVATSMAAGAFGTQTGVSLYAPTTGASLTTFRGTDGMASTRGVMPLTWGQDYAGPMARTVTDLAYLLNATTGTDPEDLLLTKDADEHRPEDWTASLDLNALKGKRIGYLPSSFVSTYANDGTGEAVKSHFADLEAAGATMVEMSAAPSGGRSPSGDKTEEGWARYIELHKDFPFADGDAIYASSLNLPYNQSNSDVPRMTTEQVNAWLEYRSNYKNIIAEWMDQYDVDAVVYPGFISDMYNNGGSSSQSSSDRGTGVLTSNVGLPTVVVPVGTNPNGYSISMQLVGRAWTDAEILGMGYALEQQAKGQQFTAFAPALKYSPSKRPSHSFDKGRPSHSYQNGSSSKNVKSERRSAEQLDQ